MHLINEYFSNIDPKLADNIDFNEGNRSYHEYLSGQNTNTTFQLKETNSLTVSSNWLGQNIH